MKINEIMIPHILGLNYKICIESWQNMLALILVVFDL